MSNLGILLGFLFLSPCVFSADDFSYRNDGFVSEPISRQPEPRAPINPPQSVPQVEPSIFGDSGGETTRNDSTSFDDISEIPEIAPGYSSRPVLRPRLPAVPSEPADLSIPVKGGQGTKFTNTSAKDRKAPIFPKVQDVMKKCGEGCDAAWAHCYRSGSPNSCHATGDAMDLHGLICDGVKQGPTSATFRRVVACIRRQKYEGVLWKALHMETTKMSSRDCRNASSTHMQTTCHWDHVHLSLGCWRKNSSGQLRKKY